MPNDTQVYIFIPRYFEFGIKAPINTVFLLTKYYYIELLENTDHL